MDKEAIMKKFIIVFSGVITALFSIVTLANEPDFNANPFLEEHATQQQGVRLFSFTKTPIALHESDKSNAAENTDYLRLALETKANGYTLVDTSQIKDIEKVIAEHKYGHELFLRNLKPEIMAAQSIADQTNLSQQFSGDSVGLESILKQHEFTVISSMVGGNFITGSGWDQLTQIVKSDMFGTVIIQVRDFSHNGGVYMDADAVNYYVNSYPGILYVLKDEVDNVYTSLGWATDEQSYQLSLTKNINEVSLAKQFKALIMAM
ncbi:hypothetical protein PMAG_a2117 [Pseudoalteromonas mariniglutinosa NCIMB 1770]|nr:hypothetical protein [Pseudoalteromonas mariniglutinosa NCIMB 1770]